MNAVKIDPEAVHKKYIIPPLENILKKPKSKQRHLIHLRTREPQLINGKYKLDFHGLAKKPSGKNFILCQEVNKEKKECLILGKQKEDEYLIQAKYPLTILEAFCLSLSSLSSKILA